MVQVVADKFVSAGLMTKTEGSDVAFCAGDAVCVAPGHKLQDSGQCQIGPYGDASWCITAGPGVEGVVARVEGSEIAVTFPKDKCDINIQKRGFGNDPHVDNPILKAKAHQLLVLATRVVTCCIDKDESDPSGIKVNCFGVDGSLLQALSGQGLKVSEIRAAIAELCSVPEGSIRLVKPEGRFLEDKDLEGRWR
jgi:hypothetical protein